MKVKPYLPLSLLCALLIVSAWIPFEQGEDTVLEALGAPAASRRNFFTSQTQGWLIETIDTSGGEWTDIALNANGHPYISYYTSTLSSVILGFGNVSPLGYSTRWR